MTTERTDHAELAGNAIGKALTLAEDEEATSITHAFIANARAMLALVEQQRIANLIELSNPRQLPNGGQASYMLYHPETLELRDEVREGLGL